MTVASLYATFLILHWKRTGFWIYLALSVVGTAANLYYASVTSGLVGILMTLITAVFLFYGGNKRQWNHFD
jgi:hypothetical protein